MVGCPKGLNKCPIEVFYFYTRVTLIIYLIPRMEFPLRFPVKFSSKLITNVTMSFVL